jgi:hypothetical protein
MDTKIACPFAFPELAEVLFQPGFLRRHQILRPMSARYPNANPLDPEALQAQSLPNAVQHV